MTLIDEALAELETADLPLVMEGGSALMVLLGEAVLARMGYPVLGKADVKFEIDEATRIIITWKGA